MKRILTIVLAILAGLPVSIGSLSCIARMDSIAVAYAPFESTTLLWIAEDQGFFKRNGLGLTLRKYDTGAGALNGVLKGEADIGMGIAEFPVAGRVFLRESIRIIGNVDEADFIYIVARKDRGIEKAVDLKGKRVGTTLGTVAQFHLGRFLNLNGLNMQDVTLVDIKTPEGWVNAVPNGEIDAIATSQPYAYRCKELLGANAVYLPAQSSQPLYGLVVAGNDWVGNHPDVVARFLKSILQAEDYLIRNPAKAKGVMQKQFDLDDAYLEEAWAQNRFSVSLKQSLILTMEDEARWMISNGLTAEKQVPNFLNFIDEDALKALKPQAVDIIR